MQCPNRLFLSVWAPPSHRSRPFSASGQPSGSVGLRWREQAGLTQEARNAGGCMSRPGLIVYVISIDDQKLTG
jgi:hypothetical protein